ncbi:MAG: HNH endonuclease family protein [Candidatus Planktophila sp.]
MSHWEKGLVAVLLATLAWPVAPVMAADQKASAVLESLAVKGRAPKTGYDRASWGEWADPDGNGCDTRNDILQRDLKSITYKFVNDRCVVVTGVLLDPYSGTTIEFLRGIGTSSLVQIDHVVAVSDAWQKGAFKWGSATKIAFYNDPLNLLAVQGRLNSQKGDGDAATWLPPLKSFRCSYVARQIAVKEKYSIWVTKAEKVAMLSILAKCPGQLLPSH